MKKTNALLLALALCTLPVSAGQTPANAPVVDGRGFIVEPEGEEMDYMVRYIYTEGYGTNQEGGIEAEVYYNAQDGCVYIKNLIKAADNDAYVCGQLDGDMSHGTITIENGVLCGSMTDVGKIYARVMTYNESQEAYVVDPNAQNFQFTVEDGIIHGEDVYLAGVDRTGTSYIMQGNMRYDPVDVSSMTDVVVPAGATTEYYTMSVCEAGTTQRQDKGVVRVARLDNDFYFSGVFDANGVTKGYVIHGTLNGNTIDVTTPQFIKTDHGSYDTYMFLNTCTVVKGDDGDVSGYTVNEPGTLQLSYDAATGTIKASDDCMIAVLGGNFALADGNSVYAPHFVKYTDEEQIIVPAGATVKTYWLNSEYDDQGNHQGALVKIARDGNDFYFMNADGKGDDVLFKGTLNSETNEIVAPSQQFVGIINGKPHYLTLAQSEIVMDDSGWSYYSNIEYTIDNEATTASFTLDPTTGNIKCNDLIGITDADRSDLYKYFIRPNYILVAEPVNTIPGGAQHLQYVLAAQEQGQGTAMVIDADRDGDDIYFTIPVGFDMNTLVTIKGTISGDKVNFAIPQLINAAGMFLRVGEAVENETQNYELEYYQWNEWIDAENVTSISMDIDNNTGVISYNDNLSIVDVDGYTIQSKCAETYFNGWEAIYITFPKPIFTPYAPNGATPADPYNLAFKDKAEDFAGRYCFDFDIPFKDVDGNYLDSDSISWRIYVDSESNVFVFTPQDYPEDFAKNTIDVWMTQPASTSLPHSYTDNNMRSVFMTDAPQHKIGVRSSFHHNGNVTHSNIVWLEIDGSGVEETIGNSTATVVGYYDLQGRQLAAPASQGITIVKMSDGTAHKIIMK